MGALYYKHNKNPVKTSLLVDHRSVMRRRVKNRQTLHKHEVIFLCVKLGLHTSPCPLEYPPYQRTQPSVTLSKYKGFILNS